jgi:hypothetical protein
MQQSTWLWGGLLTTPLIEVIMTDDSSRYGPEQSVPQKADDLRVFQFSLTSVFVVMTGMAFVLSAYFAVGRLLGMTTGEVLARGFGSFLFSLPTLLVWTVGLTIAIRRRRRNRFSATLTTIALGGATLTVFVLQLVQMVLMQSVSSGRIGHEAISWGFASIGALSGILSAIWWVLILLAVFARRPPDVLQAEATKRNDDRVGHDRQASQDTSAVNYDERPLLP